MPAVGENPLSVAADEIIDRLYGLRPDEFTRARDEAARELRGQGRRQESEQVKALRKPTAAAAAVNQLVRKHRPEVEALLRAAARLRDAQLAGKGDPVSAAQAEREALDTLIGLGGDAVRATLQAAAVDEDLARELLQGRLEREPEPRGFGTLLAHARPGAVKATVAKPAKPDARRAAPRRRTAPQPARPGDRAARARLREAKEMLTAAQSEEREARRRWAESQRELEKAQKAIERAQRQLDRLHGR